MIEQNYFSLMKIDQLLNFFELSGADKITREWGFSNDQKQIQQDRLPLRALALQILLDRMPAVRCPDLTGQGWRFHRFQGVQKK